MRTRNRTSQPPAPERRTGCLPCAADLHHCHATLVLHADGSAECEGSAACETREDLHDWWITCTDLGCGCTGDEQPRPELLLAA